VGARIAQMVGAEAAWSAPARPARLLCGTAALRGGTDMEKIVRLPDTTGMKNEVDHPEDPPVWLRPCRARGRIKMIEVETREELERAMNPRTAMMLFFNDADERGQVRAEEFAQLGKKHNVPTMTDAAADVPPVAAPLEYLKMGFDLVCSPVVRRSVDLRARACCFGRKNLIEAARMNTSPNSDTIGRGLKVNKEEMLGMMVALEVFMKKDWDAERRELDRRIKVIADAAKGNARARDARQRAADRQPLAATPHEMGLLQLTVTMWSCGKWLAIGGTLTRVSSPGVPFAASAITLMRRSSSRRSASQSFFMKTSNATIMPSISSLFTLRPRPIVSLLGDVFMRAARSDSCGRAAGPRSEVHGSPYHRRTPRGRSPS